MLDRVGKWWHLWIPSIVAIVMLWLATLTGANTYAAKPALFALDSSSSTLQGDRQELSKPYGRVKPYKFAGDYAVSLGMPQDGRQVTKQGVNTRLDCEPSWRIVASPNAGSGENVLLSVAVVSANDVWAVGYYYAAGVPRTLAQHWNGVSWSITATPNVGASLNILADVTAVSSSDVWAVGSYYYSGDLSRSLAMHWNGTQWTVFSTPNPGAAYNDTYLNSVQSVAANNVWAVGDYWDGYAIYRTFVAHWDGSGWSQVGSPDIGNQGNYLYDITAVSANELWATGVYVVDNVVRTLIVRWDYSYWTAVTSPNTGAGDNYLFSITTAAPNDLWAVGYTDYGSIHQTLIEHWDGTSWRIVPSPNPDATYSALYGVDAISAYDVWAVGTYHEGSIPHTLVTRWNGATWNAVASPNVEPSTSVLANLAIVSSNDIWAVGFYGDLSLNAYRTLVERFTDAEPCATPTPTATPSPTPCTPGIFSDVPPGSTFYPFVTCLVNRGIISGYADCTFRPNNEVTRGQLAKIVSNAAGFTESPDPQIFEDVPSSNTFYEWINRLARRGYMGGYPCGGSGEPCTSGMPYFRPSANATRGQTSKIVSNAAQYTEIPTDQTFEDVPSTHTFYNEIQRLASRNIMQGYACGGVGEPCLSGKPYFRPANNVTRGQSAKIVANTFYPGCNPSVQP